MTIEIVAIYISVGLLAFFGGYTYSRVCELERRVRALMRVIKRDQHTIERANDTIEKTAGSIKKLTEVLYGEKSEDWPERLI